MDYKIETIAEHSFVSSLMRADSKVLDAGCRGFEFTEAFRKASCFVVAIDADDLGDKFYYQVALSDFNGVGYLVKSEDKQATRIQKYPATDFGIQCKTLQRISEELSIDFWDLIKLDIEGSEYEVIMSFQKAPAKQLSIEFHLHTGVYGWYEMTLMTDKLKALGYEATKHELTEQYGAGKNYWDSLFILK